MFSHIMIGSNDMGRSKKIDPDALFGAMGAGPGVEDARGRVAYSHNGGRFMITKPIDGKPATAAERGYRWLSNEGCGAGRGVAQGRCRQWWNLNRGSARVSAPRRLSGISSRSRRS